MSTAKTQGRKPAMTQKGKMSGSPKPEMFAMKTWIDRAHFLELYAEGKIKSIRVQRVGGGYVLYYRLDAPGSKEAPLLKSRTKSVYVWTTLDSLVVWVCEFTNFKTLTISLEPNL